MLVNSPLKWGEERLVVNSPLKGEERLLVNSPLKGEEIVELRLLQGFAPRNDRNKE